MLINKTAVTQTVRLVLENGQKDSINLQPKSRATPPAGAVIDPRYHGQYANTIGGTESYKAPAATDK